VAQTFFVLIFNGKFVLLSTSLTIDMVIAFGLKRNKKALLFAYLGVKKDFFVFLFLH